MNMLKPLDHYVTYTDPGSLEQAHAWRTALIEEISDISVQLADKNKTDRCHLCNGHGCDNCGNRGSIRWLPERYHTWRRGALTALRARENTLRRINGWIMVNDVTGEGAATVLIKKAYDLLQDLKEGDVDFDKEELDTIDSLRDYLLPRLTP